MKQTELRLNQSNPSTLKTTTTMTPQILPTEPKEILIAGQYTKSEWLQLSDIERREISYNRYLQNVANAPKVNYDSLILSALYEIIYYISNGLFEAFSVVKGDVTANVFIQNEKDFYVTIKTPTQYIKFCDDKELFFSKLQVKTFEKLVGAKTAKLLKAELPAETVSTTNEVFEIGKSSCKKLSAIQVKTYSNPKDNLAVYANVNHSYWMVSSNYLNEFHFKPVNGVDFKINLDYFNGFEFFAIESKKEKKSYITVYEKTTGFKVVESWICFLDSELTKKSQCNVEFSGLIKSAINNLPFTIEPNESIESINQKRIAQNEIYVFGTTQEVEPITETQPETNEENEIESEPESNQEPTSQNKTMQPQPTQPQNESPAIAKIVNYTQDKIDNWYSNVKEEYGIIGNAQVSYHEPTDAFIIKGIENGKKTYFSISCRDGVPSIDYVFNVWMEEFKVVENSQPQTLTVGQKIQGENCHLIVIAVKEAKQAETQPTQETANEPTQEPSNEPI